MRCKACDIILSNDDLKRKAEDWEYCSECRFQSTRLFSINDFEYAHGSICSVQMDGSTLLIEGSSSSSDDTDDY
jgi:hypothetical protein